MENKAIAKQIIDFHKATFNNSFNTLSILQQQMENMVQTFVQQSTWFPVEGKEAINEWENMYNKGCIDFKEVVNNNYKKVEDFFAFSETAAKTKTSKSK